MERTVPKIASEEIELYLRTLYSLLRSTTEIQIRTLEEVHAGMNSLLHPYARQIEPDASAFIYSLLRLPEIMPNVNTIILGQSSSVFRNHGFANVNDWVSVNTKARRRRCFFDGKDKLACFIASRSDIEDVIPAVTAYQIEWNKLHLLLNQIPDDYNFDDVYESETKFLELSKHLHLDVDDFRRFQFIWGTQFLDYLKLIKDKKCDFRVNLLAGSLSEYWKATRAWWQNIEKSQPLITERPIYFISSNTHSIPNLLSSFALKKEEEIKDFLSSENEDNLFDEYKSIKNKQEDARLENLLYYALKKAQQTKKFKYLKQDQIQDELSKGIERIFSKHYFDVDAHVIELKKLKVDDFDPRLEGCIDQDTLKNSDSIILNIDYPLGLAAYNILTKVAEQSSPILGVYILGKAATLNGVLGDVMIPNVVYDEHSQNTYMFGNAFSAKDIVNDLVYGTVLDNQKAVTVLGTFLQNGKLADVFYREGYSDIEMEAGPYLSAIFEMYRPTRHPVNEIVNLYNINFDLGILHYASDTPLSKGKNLGAGALSYFGMDSTYASSLAILRRIFQLEKNRIHGKRELS
ncbi:MAG TPA: hypothetical protein VK856_03665 [Anaerolineaceae bacterium]|nr:hypothetical protein [Anaerolineaceae bacterium]